MGGGVARLPALEVCGPPGRDRCEGPRARQVEGRCQEYDGEWGRAPVDGYPPPLAVNGVVAVARPLLWGGGLVLQPPGKEWLGKGRCLNPPMRGMAQQSLFYIFIFTLLLCALQI